MASRTCPTSKIRLGYHLCGSGIFNMQQNRIYPWPDVFLNQYVPEPTNSQKQIVAGFRDGTRQYSAFFDFASGTNFAGGIRVRMSQYHNLGYVRIPDSQFHSGYTSPSYNATFAVCGFYDIYWDYNSNYPNGFEIMVNSGALGGYFRGISDNPNATIGIDGMRINGHGPDGTSSSTYFDDGGTVTNLTIRIPWNDINAVDDIYVYFSTGVGDPVNPEGTTSTTAPTTRRTTTTTTTTTLKPPKTTTTTAAPTTTTTTAAPTTRRTTTTTTAAPTTTTTTTTTTAAPTTTTTTTTTTAAPTTNPGFTTLRPRPTENEK